MIKIRKGAFETNSSSMHTIILAGTRTSRNHIPHIYGDGKILKNRFVITEEDIDFSGYSTGKTLTEWTDRFCYALAYYYTMHGVSKDCIKEINETFEKYVHRHYPDMIVEFPEDLNDDYLYYINHQSQDVLETFLKDNTMSVEDFIFNDKVFVYTPSDGCDDEYIIKLALDNGFNNLESMTVFNRTYDIKFNSIVINGFDDIEGIL